MWLITLEKLIELKLQDLMVHLDLPEALAGSLDPSVRDEYGRIFRAARSGMESGPQER